MRIHRLGSGLRRLFSVVLIGLLVAGAVPFPAMRVATGEATGVGLPTVSEQAAQAAALGLSTAQPPRYAPDGSEIDKTQSPLGRDRVVINQIKQLAWNFGKDGSNYQYLINNPLKGASAMIDLNGPVSSHISGLKSWSPLQQETVGADLDGNGLEELVTIGITPGGRLHFYVTDYNRILANGKPWVSTLFTVDSTPALTSLPDTMRLIKAAAADLNHDGKDEIVIAPALGKFYVCGVNMTSDTSSILSSWAIGVLDLEAGDVDKDGYRDLLVAASDGLLIYSGTTDLARPTARVPLTAKDSYGNNQRLYRLLTVDVGDVFASGENVIMVGGTNSDNSLYGLISVRYQPATKTYSADKYYQVSDGSEPNFGAIQKTDYDLRCVALRTLTPGVGEDVVFGGFIFRYDADTGAFKQVLIDESKNSSGYTNNTPESASHNIANANPKEDEVWIFKTLVGNFDGNLEGREQAIMLHYTQWHSSAFVYLTGVRQVGEKIITYSSRIWKKGDPYYHPTISAPYSLDRGVTMEFLSERSTFGFSDPVITAVLAAPPYYQELLDDYPTLGTWTIYGTGSENSTTQGNSVGVTVGRAIGFEQQAGIFGIDLLGGGWEVAMNTSFTSSWSTTESISRNLSFMNYASYDQVALLVVPYDTYYFKATSKETRDPNTGLPLERTVVVQVPYSPVTTMMPVSAYNQKAASMPNAPIISDDVLHHTVGDPRTYATTAAVISNLPDEGVLLAAKTEAAAFTTCGIGDGSIDQTIQSSMAKDAGYDFGISVEASCYLMAAGLKVTMSGSAEYSRSVSFSSSESTTRSGVVASVPLGYEQYQFNWALAVYNYQLQAGEGTQTFPVVNYLVRYDGEAPPYIPSNLRVDSQDLGKNTITWDRVSGSDIRYRVAQATDAAGPYVELTGASGQTDLTYQVSGLAQNQDYYYQVWAQNGSKSSKLSEPLAVTTLAVTGMTISTQPRLAYEEGEALDLSAMVLSLHLSNGQTKQEPYQRVIRVNPREVELAPCTTSLADGVALVASQHGTPITVRHTLYDVSANTGNLTIAAKSPYEFGIATTFQVGSTANATALVGGQNLQATVNLTNKTTTARNAIVVLALYNGRGTMVQMSFASKSVAAGGNETATLQLTLPGSVGGHTAKVFTWDGTSFTSTTVTPLTPVVSLSA